MIDHYKYNENIFTLAKKWLKECNYKIIFFLESLILTISFIIVLEKIIEKNRIHFYKCGINATCKFHLFIYIER